ncbi:Hypothetical protein NocV09_01900400, partial [Nannochloropsis oceanica]
MGRRSGNSTVPQQQLPHLQQQQQQSKVVVEVKIQGRQFVPSSLILVQGQTVGWVNEEYDTKTPHVIHIKPTPGTIANNSNTMVIGRNRRNNTEAEAAAATAALEAMAWSSSSALEPGDGFEHTFTHPGIYICKSPSVPTMRCRIEVLPREDMENDKMDTREVRHPSYKEKSAQQHWQQHQPQLEKSGEGEVGLMEEGEESCILSGTMTRRTNTGPFAFLLLLL